MSLKDWPASDNGSLASLIGHCCTFIAKLVAAQTSHICGMGARDTGSPNILDRHGTARTVVAVI